MWMSRHRAIPYAVPVARARRFRERRATLVVSRPITASRRGCNFDEIVT
jgi:hypothetical protein